MASEEVEKNVETPENGMLLTINRDIQSSIKKAIYSLVGLIIIWGIYGLFRLSNDIFLVAGALYFFVLPASGIAIILLLIYLFLWLVGRRKRKTYRETGVYLIREL